MPPGLEKGLALQGLIYVLREMAPYVSSKIMFGSMSSGACKPSSPSFRARNPSTCYNFCSESSNAKNYMSSKSVLSEVSFGSTMIQKLRRISLDANLLRTLGLEEGDSLDVALMIETGEIRLRKVLSGRRKQPSQSEDGKS